MKCEHVLCAKDLGGKHSVRSRLSFVPSLSHALADVNSPLFDTVTGHQNLPDRIEAICARCTRSVPMIRLRSNGVSSSVEYPVHQRNLAEANWSCDPTSQLPDPVRRCLQPFEASINELVDAYKVRGS